ncbi:endonuclease VII domain-containing protein [Streptomyces anulatus]|uniref:endonuclease domain-containing protein n=1 Tax=Streptomyces anulatus TaxID=1892 RepID=UPI002255AFF2|nr:endonuclease domain-containing protein [Streptomyces anulatus]MCX4489879.1 endonuclease VII domain-containing protein [Streptomyces anulatus]
MTTNPWEELDSLGGRTKEELLDLLRRLDDVPRPARRHTQVYADEYAGHHYRRVRPDKFQCCMCEQTASSWDHCHPHNYVRGPLCGRCNNMESRWRAEGKFPAYFAKCPDCAP